MEIRTAGQAEYSQKLRMLVASQALTDRLDFGASFNSPLIVTANPDLVSLGRLGCQFVVIESMEDLFDVRVALDRDSEELEELFGKVYETVVFDSLEDIQRILLDEHLKAEGRTETKIEDWGWVGKTFHNIFGAFSKLDLDLVFLSGLKDVPVSENETWVKPALQGAFADQIQRYMNLSVLLRSNTTEEVVEETSEITVQTADENVDDTVVEIEASESATTAWLLTKPVSYAEWVHDSFDVLPFRMAVGSDVPDQIRDMINENLPETESETQEVDPYPEEEDSTEEPETNDTENLCDECGSEVESNWLLLSEMNDLPPLCKIHFSKRNKTKKETVNA